MNPINTIEGLLFRSYLCCYNLSLLHKCIQASLEDFDNESFVRSALCKTTKEFDKAKMRAHRMTEDYLNYCAKNNIQVIAHFHEAFPPQLKRMKDFPPLLFIKGVLPPNKCAAVVGKRAVSPLAADKTNAIVKLFAEEGFAIVSGLALGVDTLAHEAALKCKGFTSAILPKPVADIYPPENISLANRILDQGGALISEQAPHYHSVANAFVLRNRIQAALSEYIIPVEMGTQSGTMYTLKYAARYKKKILLCLPGRLEIDQFLPYYEGLLTAVKKWKSSQNNIIILKSTNEIKHHLQKGKPDAQASLF